MNEEAQIQTLKHDALGRVERVVHEGTVYVRRVASGGSVPGSAWLARRLLFRERRALDRLQQMDGVPWVIDDPASVGGRPATLARSWIDGVPLSKAEELPEDFFDELDALVMRLHEAGVCHNDLHKEQNVLVRPDGRPALIDFQLASRHPRRTKLYRSRVRDDLRHVHKHRKRYLKPGRGPSGGVAAVSLVQGRGHGISRSPVAWAWLRFAKPVYLFVTRRVLKTSDGEERRPSSGPWPRWTSPIGAGDTQDPS